MKVVLFCGGLGTLPRSNTSPQAAPTASASGPAAASTQIAAAGITASGTPNGSCTRTSPASRHTAAAYGRSRAFAGAGESMRTLSVSTSSAKPCTCAFSRNTIHVTRRLFFTASSTCGHMDRMPAVDTVPGSDAAASARAKSIAAPRKAAI